jgi:hypothetical protein
VELSTLDAVFIRKDPPFDGAYGHLTRQLDLVKDRVLVVKGRVDRREEGETKVVALEVTPFDAVPLTGMLSTTTVVTGTVQSANLDTWQLIINTATTIILLRSLCRPTTLATRLATR